MGIELLELRLSGGAANTDPALCTSISDGAMSSTKVLSQSASFSAIPGITFVNAAGNTVGTGSLAFNYVAKTMQWTPPFGTGGPLVSVGTSGTYIIRGGGSLSGYVVVSVIAGALPAVDYIRTTTITDQDTKFLPAVDRDTALAGATEYLLYYLLNNGADTIKTIAVSLDTDTQALDTLSVAVVATVNTTELQAAASGHTYSALGVPVAMGDLTLGDYWGIWVKRVTPLGAVDAVTANTFKFLITALT